MVGEVVDAVSHGVDEVHPAELVGGEELDGLGEQPAKPVPDAVFDRRLAVGEFDDGAVEDGVGGGDEEGCD